MRAIGEIMRATRDSRGITQSELGRLVGLEQAQIAHYEAGRREPNIANLRKLAQALRVSADYLLDLESNGFEEGYRRGAFDAVEAMKIATRDIRLNLTAA